MLTGELKLTLILQGFIKYLIVKRLYGVREGTEVLEELTKRVIDGCHESITFTVLESKEIKVTFNAIITFLDKEDVEKEDGYSFYEEMYVTEKEEITEILENLIKKENTFHSQIVEQYAISMEKKDRCLLRNWERHQNFFCEETIKKEVKEIIVDMKRYDKIFNKKAE